jgi:ribosomal protein L11 methyltransferase
MQWIELSVSANSETVEPVVSVLDRHGQGGAAVEEQTSEVTGEKVFTVKIYLPDSRSFSSVRLDIEEDLKQLPFPTSLIERRLKQEDWFASLKKDFLVKEIGQKLVIKPSWAELPLAASGKVVIELEPGAAFGTGLHPTTRLCLVELEKHLQPGMTVFDLGTGTGILAIAAARLGAASVLALDIDPVAVKAARSNISGNGVGSQILVRRGTLSLRVRSQYKSRFDMALANITAKAISDLAVGLARVLKPGGTLIASGIHAEGLDQVLISLAIADFKFESIGQEGQWHVVVAVKEA